MRFKKYKHAGRENQAFRFPFLTMKQPWHQAGGLDLWIPSLQYPLLLSSVNLLPKYSASPESLIALLCESHRYRVGESADPLGTVEQRD